MPTARSTPPSPLSPKLGGSITTRSCSPITVEPMLYASTIAPPNYVAEVMAHKAKFNDPDSPMLAGLKDWNDRKAAGCFNKDMTTATFEAGAKAVYTGTAAYQMIHSNIAAVYLD